MFFPFGIAWAQTLLAQRLLLVGGHLVVGDRDALATTAVLAVQAHYGVGCSARAAKEIDYDCMVFFREHKP